MIGLFRNIRGFNKTGRTAMVANAIKANKVDFIGIQETKKSDFHPSFLRELSGNIPFAWNFLPAVGTAGGILIGVREDLYNVVVGDKLQFSLAVMITDRKSNFVWKLIVVYGPPYEDGKLAFIDELHTVMNSWSGPTIIGGDFNLSRFVEDKSNGVINLNWANCFNDWVNRWGLMEINPSNRKFTWANN